MARPAIRLGILERRCGVTLLALHQHVPSQQREGRHLAVVKGGLVPGLFVMASLAFLAFLSFVLVVLLVAGETSRLQLVLVQIALVATRALGLLVLAQQRILGLVVIELDFFPVFLVVARLALRPEVALVRLVVLFLVTGMHRSYP